MRRLTMVSDQALDRWRKDIIVDPIMSQRALDGLERASHPQFIALCRILAEDADVRVRKIALRKLGQRGDRDDPRAEESAIKALGEPALLNTALFALGQVGTRRAFPVLLAYARTGSHVALAAASNMTRTADEVQELLRLARQFLMLPGGANFYLREESLQILLRHSDATAEKEVLLRSAELYADDGVISALGDVKSDISEALKVMRSQYPRDSVEYKAFSHALDMIEMRKAASYSSDS